MNTEFETLNSKEIEGASVQPTCEIRDFKEDIDSFIGHRIDNMGGIIINNGVYKNAHSEATKLYNQLKEILTEEQLKLFVRYDEANTYADAVAQEIIYKRGIKDGNKLSKLLQED